MPISKKLRPIRRTGWSDGTDHGDLTFAEVRFWWFSHYLLVSRYIGLVLFYIFSHYLLQIFRSSSCKLFRVEASPLKNGEPLYLIHQQVCCFTHQMVNNPSLVINHYHTQSEKSPFYYCLLFHFDPMCGISLYFAGEKICGEWPDQYQRLAFLMARGGEAAANTVRG